MNPVFRQEVIQLRHGPLNFQLLPVLLLASRRFSYPVYRRHPYSQDPHVLVLLINAFSAFFAVGIVAVILL